MSRLRLFVTVCLFIALQADAERRPYDFGDFTLTIGDGRQTLEILRGPCSGEVQENRQFFMDGPGVICFVICDGTELCFEIGTDETSAELFPTVDVVHWDGRFVSAKAELLDLSKTTVGDGFVADSNQVTLDLTVLFGTGVIQIPDGYHTETFYEDTNNDGVYDANDTALESSEGIIEFFDITDFPRPRFYLVNVDDLNEQDLLTGVIPKALQLDLPPVEPYQYVRLSPPQVACPLYQYNFLYDIELPGDGTYMLVVEAEKEDGFSVDPTPLIEQLQLIAPDEIFGAVNADGALGTGEPAKRSFAFPLLVRNPRSGESVNMGNMFSWLWWTDSDQDFLPDDWENEVFAGLPFDAHSDEDADGHDNFTEFFKGTDPNPEDRIRIYVKNNERDGEVERLEFNKFWLGDNWFPRYQNLYWRIDPTQNYKGYDVYIQKITQDGLTVYDNSIDGIPSHWENTYGDDTRARHSQLLYTDQAYIFVIHWAVVGDDGDSIDGIWEIDNGFDPLTPDLDTDGDGASDDWETEHGFNPNDPNDISDDNDADGDGLSDLVEADLRTNPNTEFTDDDVFPDKYEANTPGLNPRSYDSPYGDFDQDNVPNHAEYWLGFDPNLWDSDDDGVSDYDENSDTDIMPDEWEARQHELTTFDGKDQIRYFLDAQIEDDDGDPDGDLLLNDAEYLAGTSAIDPDSDNDCISDAYEDTHDGLDPLDGSDWSDDEDGDGVLNFHEFLLDFDPNAVRTAGNAEDDAVISADGDLMPDAWEASFTLRNWDSEAEEYICARRLDWEIDDGGNDYDGDTLPNYYEYDVSKTSPVDQDTDADGMSDDYETNNGLNPLDADDALGDLDGDGATNLFEHDRNTNPNSDSEFPSDVPTVVTFVSPLDQYTEVFGGTLDIVVTAVDSDSEINRVEFFINGELHMTDIHASGSDRYSVNNWKPLAPGAYILKADSVDSYGHRFSATVTIQITADEDSDLMDDGWELQHFGNLDQYGTDDFDGDGFSNVFEYHHGTDPNNEDAGDTDTSDDTPVFAEEQNGAYKYYIVDSTLEYSEETDYRKKTIGRAIRAANDFDIIEVTAGLYTENVDLNDRIYLFGASGAANTIVDGSSRNDYVLDMREESVVQGMTLRGAKRESRYGEGGGVYVHVASNHYPRFVGCIIAENEAPGEGGAVFVSRGNPSFVSCTIALNSARQVTYQQKNKGAIYNNSMLNRISLVNSLLWNPDCGEDELAGMLDANSTDGIDNDLITLTSTLIRNGSSGDISIDWVDIAGGPYEMPITRNFGIIKGSPAHNAGNNSAEYSNPDKDDELLTDGLRDIGADELIDTDDDGLSDLFEAKYSVADPAANDDADSLNNLAEYIAGTDPTNADTDGDTLLDDDELVAAGASDTDGLTTDPLNPDDDGDGLPTAWEILYGLDYTDAGFYIEPDENGVLIEYDDGDNGALGDPDGDTLTNKREHELGTDPQSNDSDSDDLPDDWEVANRLDPLVDDADENTDGDELTHAQEYAAGTNPNQSDTDNDSLPDHWEVQYGIDPNDNGSTDPDAGPLGDPDGDQANNAMEFALDTDPTVADVGINAPSVITLDTPSANVTILAGEALVLEATATDPDATSPIDRVEFYIDTAETEAKRIQTVYLAENDVYAGAWSAPVVLDEQDTAYTLSARVYDVFEHSVDATETITVTVLADNDRDGLGDTWEQSYFGDLTQAWDGDFDGDDATNRFEWVSSTDPTDSADTPANAASVVTLLRPVDSDSVEEGDSMLLSASVVDLDTAIERVEFERWSEQSLGTVTALENYSVYTWAWNNPTVPVSYQYNGIELNALVYDQGNSLITTVPLTAIYAVNLDGTTNFQLLNLSVELIDAGVALDRVEFRRIEDGVSQLLTSLSPSAQIQKRAQLDSVPLDNTTSLQHLFRADVLDATQTLLERITIVPEYPLDAFGNEDRDTILLTVDTSHLATADRVEFYVEKTERLTNLNEPDAGDVYSWLWPEVSSLGANEYVHTATAYDIYGHAVTSSPATVTLIGDADRDGLYDDWEQALIDADPNDAIVSIHDVHPFDDFDGDGATNLYEFINNTGATDGMDQPANAASTITWLHPSDTQTGWEGETLQLRVTATDSDTAISQVEFYIDGTFYGVDRIAPADEFSIYWLKPEAVNSVDTDYSLTAKVVDIYGHSVETAPIVYTVWADDDGDRLRDEWEQQIIDADSNDSITNVADVLPGDDFDNDNANNLFEYLNDTDPVVANTPQTNALSVVTLVGPADNATHWQFEPVSLVATATDADAGIDRVEFYYQGSGDRILIGSTSQASGAGDQYRYTWTELPTEHTGLNNFSITATVFDVYAHQVTSASISLNVRADADNDRMQDDWEQQIIDDPNNVLTDQDGDGDVDIFDVLPGADHDGDGASNLFEYISGTTPTDLSSVPADTLPTVSIATSPSGTHTIWEGENLAITANATDSDSELDRVVFLADGNEIGVDYTATDDVYSVQWDAVDAVDNSAGGITNYTLTAVVYDIYDKSATSSAITVSVLEDADGDRMRDDLERFYFNGSLDQTPEGDFDNDGFSNRRELDAGTSPADNTSKPVDASSVVELIAPLNGQIEWQGDAVTLVATATDADSVIDRVEFYAGGVRIGSDSTVSTGGRYSVVWSNLPSDNPALTNHVLSAKVIDTYGQAVDSVTKTLSVQGDADFDRMADDWENLHFTNLDELPDGDFDSDGVRNLYEYILGFLPNDNDGDSDNDSVPDVMETNDGDTMPDAWELEYAEWVDFEADDGNGDPDGDTIINSLEYQYGLHPGIFNANALDLDDDGLLDSWEQQIIDAGLTDQDGDGDVDFDDVLPGDDFDQDGVLNEDEYKNGSDPTSSSNETSNDPDGDGLSSEYELLLQTNQLKRDHPDVRLRVLAPSESK